MADAATEAQLNERFAPGGGQQKALEPDMVRQLASIMNMHGLPVDELFYKWEAYCIKMDLDAGALSMDLLRKFKQDLQDALERRHQEQKQNSHHHQHQSKKGDGKRIGGATPRNAGKTDVFGLLDGIVPATPKTNGSGTTRTNGSTTKATPASRIKSTAHAASSPDFKTPTSAGRSSQQAAAGTPFNDRPNSGEVIEVLNQQLPAAVPPMVPFAQSRIKLAAGSDQKKLGYKPLAMKLSEASEILDDRIDAFTTLVMDHHRIDYEAFGSAASQGTAEIVAVGRIASDAAEGKLNAASLVLETSRRMGGGLRVSLDLGRLGGAYQFFPGQIVALRGSNTTGHAFVVSQVLELPLLPNAASTKEALQATRQRMKGGDDDYDDMEVDSGESASAAAPLQILLASGPYTADDNLDFEPLHALCSLAGDTAVDALVLTGPFLDADHPLIASGDFDLPDDLVQQAGGSFDPDTATMNTVFRFLVAPALQRLAAANPSVTILMVPSVRDILDKHVSWPQDAFPRKRDLGLPKAAKVVGNPMTLSMNEMVVGLSAQDILWELRHEELAGGRVSDPNAVSRACRYLLEQRHYFPLFPPVDRRKLPRTGVDDVYEGETNGGTGGGGGVATGSMLDTSYLKLGEMVNVRPDVLVVPSALPPFAKVVESVLVINPGYLSKRRGAGTYAKMTVYPPAVETDGANHGGEAAAATMFGHKVFEQARVEITRI